MTQSWWALRLRNKSSRTKDYPFSRIQTGCRSNCQWVPISSPNYLYLYLCSYTFHSFHLHNANGTYTVPCTYAICLFKHSPGCLNLNHKGFFKKFIYILFSLFLIIYFERAGHLSTATKDRGIWAVASASPYCNNGENLLH